MERRHIAGERYVLETSDDRYPEKLKSMYPLVRNLYVVGSLSALDMPSVSVTGPAVVGADSIRRAKGIARVVVERGLAVVSGCDPGVDEAVLTETVRLGGKAVMVLAGGVEDERILERSELLQSVIDGGGAVVSESHWTQKWLPVMRPNTNRVIAGLADVSVVTDVEHPTSSYTAVDSAVSAYRARLRRSSG